MSITALGYMGVRSPLLGDWSDYASRQLGMQQVDRGGATLSFRMDDWQQRLVLLDEPGDDCRRARHLVGVRAHRSEQDGLEGSPQTLCSIGLLLGTRLERAWPASHE